MSNPYAAPQVDLDAPQLSAETYQPRLWQVNGRIGRMRYLAYSAAIGLLMIPVAIVAVALGAASLAKGSLTPTLVAMMVVVGIAVLTISVILARRRLNDMGRTGWFMLLSLVPLVNFVFYLWMLCASGDQGSNEYGPAPAPNTTLINIAGGIMIALMVASVGFNILGGLAGYRAATSGSGSSGF
jgi:uncharacterized membrane protein YhaH (DUF805 family)